MSLYDYGLPITTNEYRDRTDAMKLHGVEYQNAVQCYGGCGQRKPRLGGTNRNGKFVCADCKKAPSLVSTLLLGLPIKFPKGKARTVSFKTEADKEQAYGEAERQKNLEEIRKAIGAGIFTRDGLKEKTGLSYMTLYRRLAELIDQEEVIKDETKKPCEWRFK